MCKSLHISVFLFLLVSVFRSPVLAQTSSGYEFISTTQGLSPGLINDISQDREGFIWIATKGGLNRYDGYTFKAFATDLQDTSSIRYNSISNLLEDRHERLSSNRIQSAMVELPNDNILLYTQGGSLFL